MAARRAIAGYLQLFDQGLVRGIGGLSLVFMFRVFR